MKKSNYEQVREDQDLARDPKTGAILNINNRSLEAYRHRRAKMRQMNELQDEVRELREQVRVLMESIKK